jgi:hypothetical protein
LTLNQLIAGRKASMVTQALFIPATLFTKISILLSYLRLAPQDSWFRRLSRVCPLSPVEELSLTWSPVYAPWVMGATCAVWWIVLFTECRYVHRLLGAPIYERGTPS